jgi:hypothetical protein
LLLVALLILGAVAATDATAEVSCHNINAKGVGQDLGEGKTVADIIGGGLLQGTTEGNFTVTGFSGSVASFVGTVVFTTNNGTLTVTLEGTLDVATGEFAASGPVTDATGKLEGATGSLDFSGVEDFSDGSFVEEVIGNVCVDLAP